MPPPLSDEEASIGSDEEMLVREKAKNKGKAKEEPKEEMRVESEEEDDDELDEDEYVVEKITNHAIDEATGEFSFEVKWEGFEKKSDRTWEPEANLETASEMVETYMNSIGGREALLEAFNRKKAAGSMKKKRGRQSNGAIDKEHKKAKKNGHPASSTPPASVDLSNFKPPPGNWEDQVVGIDACEGTQGNIQVFLTWKNGAKTQHHLDIVYRRCPQKMLKFYESHLVFKRTDSEA
ncbi:hypothetical protein BP5796_03820 [Coleophoma crateriformis]|uniref:Chromo domain-containing protein n=1 Tax=Coleophoma crateriformis TaxID=565419 RepID=A0A3D8SGM5_9HELO|nr:hypothetical protein BP5796_03820 [Coleophoma crateriformis]